MVWTYQDHRAGEHEDPVRNPECPWCAAKVRHEDPPPPPVSVVNARLRELAKHVRTYHGRPGSVFGEPRVLREICRLLGIPAGDCRHGRVFLFDTNLQRLGLPTSTEVIVSRALSPAEHFRRRVPPYPPILEPPALGVVPVGADETWAHLAPGEVLP
jgi:hypothetical protein